MHEEDFWSSWPREDEKSKEERKAEAERKGEEEGEKRKREEEKEGNETVTVKRRCGVFVSVEAFGIFSQGKDLESCGSLSWEDPLEEFENWSDCELGSRTRVRVVPDVTDVPVSPSSVITELCVVSPCRSDVEFVERQSFSFSKKRAHCCTDKQEEMRYEGSSVTAPPLSRRRMTPPTPLQNSYASFEGEQGRYEVEGRGWSAKERTLVARTKQFLERSHSMKVQVEELEDLLGPEDVDVDFRRILKEARDEKGRRIFETFSSNDMSFLVAGWSKWDT